MICIRNMVKDQFRLFFFTKTEKYPPTNRKETLIKISIYRGSFVRYPETVKSESR